MEKIKAIVTAGWFQKTLRLLGIIFIVATFFITVKPDSFLRFGYAGIFAYSIVGPGLVIVALLAQKVNLLFLILFAALGSCINTSITYAVGNGSNTILGNKKPVIKLRDLVKKYGLIAVYVLAAIPTPFDVNGLISGYLGIPYRRFVVAAFLGRTTSYLLVGLGVFTFLRIIQ